MRPLIRKGLGAVALIVANALPAQAQAAPSGDLPIVDYAAALVTTVLVLAIVCIPARRE